MVHEIIRCFICIYLFEYMQRKEINIAHERQMLYDVICLCKTSVDIIRDREKHIAKHNKDKL